MKKSLVLTALVIAIILAVWVVFKPVSSSPLETRDNNALIRAQEEMLAHAQSASAAVPLTGADFKVAPVFDVAGAIVSDPTGTILSGLRLGIAPVPVTGGAVPLTGADFKVAPVFGAAGALVSDPSGTISNK